MAVICGLLQARITPHMEISTEQLDSHNEQGAGGSRHPRRACGESDCTLLHIAPDSLDWAPPTSGASRRASPHTPIVS
ncbi:hypothetical protein SKAU_G00368310 [Synaphobranchus kaupii]|uniref:Uncharacterized protein n=1 Tax=Synaphobranchus kaupii TaxID=118154 RepID=A0A9Q1EFL2_SYNKA|nr:hypothetical protein SKAU_G00368310 [Synaphobranchus kaupii]